MTASGKPDERGQRVSDLDRYYDLVLRRLQKGDGLWEIAHRLAPVPKNCFGQELQMSREDKTIMELLEKFCDARARIAELTRERDEAREKIASAMFKCGAPTGHGDTIEDLLAEFCGHVERLTRELVATRWEWQQDMVRRDAAEADRDRLAAENERLRAEVLEEAAQVADEDAATFHRYSEEDAHDPVRQLFNQGRREGAKYVAAGLRARIAQPARDDIPDGST